MVNRFYWTFKMKFTGQHIWHLVTRSFALGLVLGFVLFNGQVGLAQSWSVNSPEVREPVPQYSPHYPLTSPARQTPESLSSSPTPVVEAEPVVQPDQSALNDPSIPSASAVLERLKLPRQSTMHAATNQPTATVPVPEPKTGTDGHAKFNWNLYRNRNPLPIDPRKPCNRCTRPAAAQPICACNLPGLKGRPHIDVEPGACQCNKTKPFKHPAYSAYWPRPFSAKLDERFPKKAAKRDEPCQEKRVVDMFDRLADFKLINYQRTDNGYCGRGADPYGCLGESRYGAQIAESAQPVR